MNEFWDRIGISASLACVVHCLFTPILVLILPVFGNFLSEPWFHWLIAAVVFPVATWALWRGYRQHHHSQTLWLGGLGLTLILVNLFWPDQSDTSVWSVASMIAAGLLLSLAHWMNLRACRHGPVAAPPVTPN